MKDKISLGGGKLLQKNFSSAHKLQIKFLPTMRRGKKNNDA